MIERGFQEPPAGDHHCNSPTTFALSRAGAPFSETVARMRSGIRERGLILFAEIDHQQNARDAGLDMLPTRVLIFGSARAGTPLMLAAPDIALELPLRVLVREEADGSVVLVYLDPERLAANWYRNARAVDRGACRDRPGRCRVAAQNGTIVVSRPSAGCPPARPGRNRARQARLLASVAGLPLTAGRPGQGRARRAGRGGAPTRPRRRRSYGHRARG